MTPSPPGIAAQATPAATATAIAAPASAAITITRLISPPSRLHVVGPFAALRPSLVAPSLRVHDVRQVGVDPRFGERNPSSTGDPPRRTGEHAPSAGDRPATELHERARAGVELRERHRRFDEAAC